MAGGTMRKKTLQERFGDWIANESHLPKELRGNESQLKFFSVEKSCTRDEFLRVTRLFADYGLILQATKISCDFKELAETKEKGNLPTIDDMLVLISRKNEPCPHPDSHHPAHE
jgi:hypothetical protein